MMTLSASTGQLWMAAAGAVAASLMFTVLEWHRPDSRYRAARIGATVLAIVALALLGLHPAWHSSNASRPVGGAMAAVWTTGQPGAPVPDIFALYRVALRGAAAPAGTAVFPDAALLLRRFPDIATVNVFGDGLDAGGIDALRGLRVVFHPPGPGDATPRPAIVFLRCPRTLALGEPLVLQGMVAGLAPATTANLTLATPDGSTAVSSSAPANHDGNSDFTLRAPAPRSIGRFIWRLRLLASSAPSAPLEEDEPLGISVVAPVLPRVLILENSPHFDTADLRRWFTQAGGTMTVRTLVGRDLYRFASSTRDAAPQFAAVDAPLLAGFDLLLADASALAALTPPEGRALVAAVTDAGLGVLTLAGDMPPAPPDASVFPWQLAPALDAPPEDGERLARPSWPGQVQAIDMPIPAAPLVIGPLPGQSALIGDGQGRTLAATVSRGRGQFALSLLHDSGRWLRGSDPAAFSAYWSLLFSRIARPLDGAAGRGSWTIAEGAGAPVFRRQCDDAPVDRRGFLRRNGRDTG